MTADAALAMNAGSTAPIGKLRAAIEILVTVLALPAALVATASVFGVRASPLGVFVPVFVAWLFMRRRGESWGAFGFARPVSWRSAARWGVLGTVLAFAASSAILLVVTRLGLGVPDISLLVGILEGDLFNYILWMVLVVWGSAAFGEELLARGFLLNRFHAIFGATGRPWLWAAIAQAGLFGMFHFYQGLVGMVSVTVVALVLAFVYLRTGRNLAAPIITHGVIDSVGVTLIYLGISPFAGFGGS